MPGLHGCTRPRWLQAMPRRERLNREARTRARLQSRTIKAFSETDFTEDLMKFDIPSLVMHGEDDQIVPVKDSGKKSARLIPGAVEIYYPGLSHGLTATHPDLINRDLLAFIREGKRKVA